MDDYLTFLYRQYIMAETFMENKGADQPVLKSRLQDYDNCISEYLRHIKEKAIEEYKEQL